MAFEMATKADILVFYANAFDMKADDGGQINGCTVHYLFWGEDGTAMVGQSEPDVTKAVGMQRGKSWVDYALRNKIRVAPAIYEGDFTMTVGSDGKPSLKLVDVAFKSMVEMRPYDLPGLDIPGMIRKTPEEMQPFDANRTAGPVTENKTEPDKKTK